MITEGKIQSLLSEKVLVLDGAMGTMIQQLGLQEKDYRGERFNDHRVSLKGNMDVLVLTQAKIIARIHEEYLRAGADIIETCTFNSTSVSLADYGLSEIAYEVNLKAARIAKELADKYTFLDMSKPRLVAGSIGPTRIMLSKNHNTENHDLPKVTFDSLVESYREQIRGLVDGGVDLLLVETVCDLTNLQAFYKAWQLNFEQGGGSPPLMVSVTITNSGLLPDGRTLTDLVDLTKGWPLMAIGVNCTIGLENITPYIEYISQNTLFPVLVMPNAGIPTSLGVFPLTDEFLVAQCVDLAKNGLINLVGGCCGTSPTYIRLLSEALVDVCPLKRY